MKFDLTINIPIMLTMLGFVAGGSAWVANVDARGEENAREIAKLASRQSSQDEKVSRQIADMRAEVRMDMRDMNGKIDQVIWRLGDPPKNLKQWEK